VRLTWVDVTYHPPRGPSLLPAGARGVLRGIAQTGEGLRRGPHDALLFLTHNPAVFRQAALRRIPTCLWTDVTPSQLDEQAEQYAHRRTWLLPLRAFKHLAVARTFRLARRCLAWSEWARRSFVRDYGIPEERTAVVPPGVDLAAWQVPHRPERRGVPRLLFVGGDFARKGGRQLLEVFRERLLGRAELDVVTRDGVAEEPGVRVHRGLSAGSEALQRLYREADAFVLPTLADCHSIASLEAMASGLPVVTTRVGANPEIVEEGETGFLVEAGDAGALARALTALVDDAGRARAMGQRGRRRAELLFDARRTVDRLVAEARRAAEG
jgi:glycosyltransferase involved in cell wall biosynthesis